MQQWCCRSWQFYYQFCPFGWYFPTCNNRISGKGHTFFPLFKAYFQIFLFGGKKRLGKKIKHTQLLGHRSQGATAKKLIVNFHIFKIIILPVNSFLLKKSWGSDTWVIAIVKGACGPFAGLQLSHFTSELPAFTDAGRNSAAVLTLPWPKPRWQERAARRSELFIQRGEKYVAKENTMSDACQVQIPTWSSQETLFFKRLHT